MEVVVEVEEAMNALGTNMEEVILEITLRWSVKIYLHSKKGKIMEGFGIGVCTACPLLVEETIIVLGGGSKLPSMNDSMLPPMMAGSIPRCLGNLSRLEILELRKNNLLGGIPSELGKLSKLRILNLVSNNLSGGLPPTIFNLNSSSAETISLEVVYLSENPLSGHIPKGLCLFKNLKKLALAANGFVGSIPRCVGNLSHLEILYLDRNKMSGEIPSELGQLANLRMLSLSHNNLSGRAPPTIFNLSSSEVISLAFNKLFGNVLELANFRLPKLQELYLSRNGFSGRISNSISNASMLKILELSNNSFNGPMPMTLGGLRNLKILSLSNNELTTDPSQRELHFLTSLTQCPQLESLNIGYNPLNGSLPTSIGNFSASLEIFEAGASQIQNSLPYQIGNLSGLLDLDLELNDLIGAFPSSMGNLHELQQLYLDNNKLEGNLPNEVCRLTSVGEFYMDENKLSGPIPSCFGNLTNIMEISLASNAFTSLRHSMWSLSNVWLMNLSFNSLTGYLPLEIGKLVNLQILDLSMNQFSATIPEIISNLKMLEQLDLSDNAFQGNIPTSIGNLGSLKSLDLSSNNLSGTVPKSLEKLYYLKYLNLSFNMLTGPIPTNGAFANFTIQSFMGNHDLCGNSKLKLPPCPDTSPSKSRKVMFLLKFVLPPIAALTLMALLLILYIKYWRKSKKLPVSSTDLSVKLGHKCISYYDLLNATNNLSEANMLGTGSFGSVYKGTMSDGDIVAVKVFDLEVEGAVTSFDKECQVLKNVRHRNLVKIISCSSNLDFRALVLQYMSNGSLEKWLYNHGQNCLNILQRMDIMIDVALGLEYLHHGYSEPIVHCDLKPSNVLLDEDMVAHVGDFGIAKILAEYKSMTQTSTLGTMGYIAPEFGLQGRVSPKVDVYSYGIMLMETFTRKSPGDEMFVEGLSLRKWIISFYPDRVLETMDTGLWARQETATIAAMDSLTQCFSSIIELSLQCSNDLPEERLNMTDTVVKLKKIKEDMV
ncbi:LRR receptor-like serine/threonine-protein kinase EFR [Ziziphus jujuba]|uniref:LRR receptor-like serine/threonine-protein kinase EFR n=1 Tax=Ziziphus jujuba TaxID=326968 RepID=A0ABM4A3X7_ZIZJJ|nr:LRR receptor-like serine/threonine-protein kinase EFR [Ziziphus jujuba]